MLYIGGTRDFLFVSTQLMLMASFMVEHTMESQIGVAIYLFLLLFCMKNMEVKKL